MDNGNTGATQLPTELSTSLKTILFINASVEAQVTYVPGSLLAPVCTSLILELCSVDQGVKKRWSALPGGLFKRVKLVYDLMLPDF